MIGLYGKQNKLGRPFEANFISTASLSNEEKRIHIVYVTFFEYIINIIKQRIIDV